MKRERVIERWLAGFVLVAGLIVVVVLLGTAAADGPPMSERAPLSFSPIHNLLPTDNVYAFGHIGVVGNIIKKNNFKVDPLCNEKDGCYPYGDGCEERDYYCKGNETGCNYTSSNRHTDSWVDTGNTRWVDVNKCEEKEQKEQEYRDYKCSEGYCNYSINDTKWIDTGIYNTTCNYVSLAPPEITSFAPLSYVDDTVCNWRTFDVTANQAVDVSWYLNGMLVLTNESVVEAKCTLHAEVVGEHNVTAIASNINGSDMQTWTWDVTELQKECEGTDTCCGIYPNCGNCNEKDGCYPYGDGCEERNYYCMGNETGCNYTSSNMHNDGWVDTGNTRWVDVNECQEKEQKEQEYRDYKCSAGCCHYSINDTKWIDTGNTSIKANGTICGCTANNTVKRCYDGNCTDTGIGNSSNCSADVVCDGKKSNRACGDICVITTGWWRDGGTFYPSDTPIQAAIDNATAGETICVKDGTYTENVDVNTPLTIQSEHGADSTIVNALDPNDHVFEVTADHVNIIGFTVQNASDNAGIYLYNSGYCTISDNTASNNAEGIFINPSNDCTLTNNIASNNDWHGIGLFSSNDCTLTNNIASNNGGRGIGLFNSNDCTLTSNIASNNSVGIILRLSSNCMLDSNTASDNEGGISIVNSSNNNVIRNNRALSNGWGGICLGDGGDPKRNVTGNSVIGNNASYNGDDGIGLEWSAGNTVIGNIVRSNHADGISLFHSNLSILEDNTAINNNKSGIGLFDSHENSISSNTVTSNYRKGIFLVSSSNNSITDNNASNNENGICLLESSDHNTVLNNIANSNTLSGICLLESSDHNTVLNNIANSNARSGIWIFGSLYNNITENTANLNNRCGIALAAISKSNIISRNTANSNNYHGIIVKANSSYESETHPWGPSDYNTISGNTADTNNRSGIFLCEGSSNNTLSSNTASDNGWHGIYLDSSDNNTINSNTAYDNYIGIGIWGSSDNMLGSNRASNNILSDFRSADSHGNVVTDLTIASYPTTISFTYDDVGLKGVDTAPSDPEGKVNINKYVNVTGLTANSWISLNVNYRDGDLGGVDETSLRMWKYDGTWTEVPPPNGVNNVENYVYANITVFSIFAPLGNPLGVLKPDLIITDTWLCWPDNCTICYNVTNTCDGTAPAGHNTALYVDGVAVAHDHVPVDLAPGESYTGCFNGYEWGYTRPSDEITVCADNNESIVELDEDNNCLTNIWLCGDVNGDGKVTMSDVRKVFNRYLDPSYPLDLPWAADVNDDGKVTMSDVRKVFNRYLDPGYDLNCCCEVL